jgi:hypothetical protein
MGQKGTGRRLSDQERIEIIAKLEGDKPRASAAECARQYGVSSAAITKLMKMKDKIKQRFQENNAFSQQRKRGGTERHTAFEEELFQWIIAQQQEQAANAATQFEVGHVPTTPLTSAKVQEKAQELLKVHDLGSFRASKGWYYRFCRRYGLSRASLSGDDGDRDDDDDHEHGGSDSEASFGGDDTANGGEATTLAVDANTSRAKIKRKEAATAAASRKKAKTGVQGWAVESLQETLAQAAMALDHPEARQYLGEPAACEMLRSIQQSIGVVQCIRLKKTASDAETYAPETKDEAADTTGSTEPASQSLAEAEVASSATGQTPQGDVIV